jgi:hypothetical protein
MLCHTFQSALIELHVDNVNSQGLIQCYTCSAPSHGNQGLCICAISAVSMHCFGSSVDLQNLVKIKGCSLTFFLVVYSNDTVDRVVDLISVLRAT